VKRKRDVKRERVKRETAKIETVRRKTVKGEIHGKESELDLAGRHFYYAPTLFLSESAGP
jgi:hypothetical protein